MTPTVTDSATEDLRAVAARKKMNQNDIATKLGKSPMWVSRRLRGVTEMTIDDFAALCEALGVDPVVRVDDTPARVKELNAERFGVITRG